MNNILHPSDIVCRVRRITNYSKSDFCVVAFDGIHRNKYRPRLAIKSRPAALHLALIMAATSPEQVALRAMFGASHFSDLMVARRNNRQLRVDYERRIDNLCYRLRSAYQERDDLHNELREDHLTSLERYRNR